MRILCIASMLAVLGACGLKAPLYLPQEQSPQSQPSQGEEKKK